MPPKGFTLARTFAPGRARPPEACSSARPIGHRDSFLPTSLFRTGAARPALPPPRWWQRGYPLARGIKAAAPVLFRLAAWLCIALCASLGHAKPADDIDRWGKPEGDYLVIGDAWVHCDRRAKCGGWAMVKIAKGSLHAAADRVNQKFHIEPRIPAIFRSGAEDYRGQDEFDIGHLWEWAAARSQTAAEATENYANAAPQNKVLNRGDWRTIVEQQSRNLSEHADVWIITGTAFASRADKHGNLTIRTIGPHQVWVPTYFWKVELPVYPDQKLPSKLYGWLAKNERPPADMLPAEYCVPVKEIEEISTYEFFNKLPPGVAEVLKGGR